MAKQFDGFDSSLRDWAGAQPIFFVATSAPEARLNLSPKGQDSLRILGANRLIWRNLTGSGNETAPHLARDARMTVMWCSFGKRPLILRAYGTARAVHRQDADWAALDAHFTPDFAARQLIDMDVEMVQTSCGYAVPMMSLEAERDVLTRWAEDRGPGGIETYWAERNSQTIDGAPTGIVEKNLGRPE